MKTLMRAGLLAVSFFSAGNCAASADSTDLHELGKLIGTTIGAALYLDAYDARCEGDRTPVHLNAVDFNLRGYCHIGVADVQSIVARATGTSAEHLQEMKARELRDTVTEAGGCSTRKMKKHIYELKAAFPGYLGALAHACPVVNNMR